MDKPMQRAAKLAYWTELHRASVEIGDTVSAAIATRMIGIYTRDGSDEDEPTAQ